MKNKELMARIYDNYYTFRSPDLFKVGARVRLFRRADGHGVVLVTELPFDAKGGGDLSSYSSVLQEMHELMTGEFMIEEYTFIGHHAQTNIVQDADKRVVGIKHSERFSHIFFTLDEEGLAEITYKRGLTRAKVQQLCEESLVD